MDFDAVKRIARALEDAGVSYVVFGSAALNLHGLARFTPDLDVFLEPTARNVEALKAALKTVYSDPAIDAITSEDLLGEHPAVQYVPPEGTFHVDLLTRLGDLFEFADLETQRIPFDGLEVSVVTSAMLYRMKRDTTRPQDRADAELLMRRRTQGRGGSVRKYRGVEEVPETWLESGSAELLRAIRAAWSLGQRTTAPRFPPGVHVHRSLEDQGLLEESWDARNLADVQGKGRTGA